MFYPYFTWAQNKRLEFKSLDRGAEGTAIASAIYQMYDQTEKGKAMPMIDAVSRFRQLPTSSVAFVGAKNFRGVKYANSTKGCKFKPTGCESIVPVIMPYFSPDARNPVSAIRRSIAGALSCGSTKFNDFLRAFAKRIVQLSDDPSRSDKAAAMLKPFIRDLAKGTLPNWTEEAPEQLLSTLGYAFFGMSRYWPGYFPGLRRMRDPISAIHIAMRESGSSIVDKADGLCDMAPMARTPIGCAPSGMPARYAYWDVDAYCTKTYSMRFYRGKTDQSGHYRTVTGSARWAIDLLKKELLAASNSNEAIMRYIELSRKYFNNMTDVTQNASTERTNFMWIMHNLLNTGSDVFSNYYCSLNHSSGQVTGTITPDAAVTCGDNTYLRLKQVVTENVNKYCKDISYYPGKQGKYFLGCVIDMDIAQLRSLRTRHTLCGYLLAGNAGLLASSENLLSVTGIIGWEKFNQSTNSYYWQNPQAKGGAYHKLLINMNAIGFDFSRWTRITVKTADGLRRIRKEILNHKTEHLSCPSTIKNFLNSSYFLSGDETSGYRSPFLGWALLTGDPTFYLNGVSQIWLDDDLSVYDTVSILTDQTAGEGLLSLPYYEIYRQDFADTYWTEIEALTHAVFILRDDELRKKSTEVHPFEYMNLCFSKNKVSSLYNHSDLIESVAVAFKGALQDVEPK